MRLIAVAVGLVVGCVAIRTSPQPIRTYPHLSATYPQPIRTYPQLRTSPHLSAPPRNLLLKIDLSAPKNNLSASKNRLLRIAACSVAVSQSSHVVYRVSPQRSARPFIDFALGQ